MARKSGKRDSKSLLMSIDKENGTIEDRKIDVKYSPQGALHVSISVSTRSQSLYNDVSSNKSDMTVTSDEARSSEISVKRNKDGSIDVGVKTDSDKSVVKHWDADEQKPMRSKSSYEDVFNRPLDGVSDSESPVKESTAVHDMKFSSKPSEQVNANQPRVSSSITERPKLGEESNTPDGRLPSGKPQLYSGSKSAQGSSDFGSTRRSGSRSKLNLTASANSAASSGSQPSSQFSSNRYYSQSASKVSSGTRMHTPSGNSSGMLSTEGSHARGGFDRPMFKDEALSENTGMDCGNNCREGGSFDSDQSKTLRVTEENLDEITRLLEQSSKRKPLRVRCNNPKCQCSYHYLKDGKLFCSKRHMKATSLQQPMSLSDGYS